MKKNIILPVAALLFFLGSRLFIIHGLDVYWTDVSLYHQAAYLAVKGGYTAYHDFWFPYPPLTLPLIYLPMYIASEITAYRTCFQYEMFFFDSLTLLYLILFLKKRLNLRNSRISAAIIVYSLLGLLLGHLLYDRTDIPISAALMISFYYFTLPETSSKPRILAYLTGLAGALVKLIPLLLWPVFAITDCFSNNPQDKNSSASGNRHLTGAGVKKLLLPVLIMVIPFTVIMLICNHLTFNTEREKGMFVFMSEHGQRGIQMESLWASPFMAADAASIKQKAEIPYPLKTNFGAQHLDNSVIPSFYLISAKFAGFAALAGIYTAFFICFFRFPDKRPILSDPVWVLTFYTASLFFIIASQRVLSPQYMIWPVPVVTALLFASNKVPRSLFFCVLLLYVFSWLNFDFGYEKLVQFDPAAVTILVIRNMFLLIVTGGLFLRLYLSLRENGNWQKKTSQH